jgi:hypothetical protein
MCSKREHIFINFAEKYRNGFLFYKGIMVSESCISHAFDKRNIKGQNVLSLSISLYVIKEAYKKKKLK